MTRTRPLLTSLAQCRAAGPTNKPLTIENLVPLVSQRAGEDSTVLLGPEIAPVLHCCRPTTNEKRGERGRISLSLLFVWFLVVGCLQIGAFGEDQPAPELNASPFAIMKLAALLLTTLAPLSLKASPIADTAGVTPRDAGNDLLTKRVAGSCRIINASAVNCRTGPGTQYGVVTSFKKGQLLFFICVQSGQCITLNGATNW